MGIYHIWFVLSIYIRAELYEMFNIHFITVLASCME